MMHEYHAVMQYRTTIALGLEILFYSRHLNANFKVWEELWNLTSLLVIRPGPAQSSKNNIQKKPMIVIE